MANFFEGVWNALKHPIDEAEWMVKSTRDVLKGDMDLKDVPGSHQEMMNNITVPILGDNKISKNSDAVAGAIVGGVLAAPMLGAMGSGGGSAFELGNVGNYFKPGTAGNQWQGLWDKVAGPSDFDLGALADAESGPGGAVGANLGTGSEALDKVGKKTDFSKMAKVLQSVQSNLNEPDMKIQSSGGPRGFNFNRKPYENPLLTREYQSLYTEPLYKNLL